MAGMTIMEMARGPDMAFACLGADQALRTVRKALVLDRGERVLRQQTRYRASDHENGLSHFVTLCMRRCSPRRDCNHVSNIPRFLLLDTAFGRMLAAVDKRKEGVLGA